MPRWLAIVVVAGCGRFDFDPLGDALRSDAAAIDAVANVCPPGALLCDDFETGDLSKWTASLLSPTASVTVDAAQVRSGSLSLDAVMPPQGNGAISAVCSDQPLLSTGMLAQREWVYSPVPLVDYDTVISFFNQPSCTVGAPSPQYATAGCDGANLWVIAENSVAGLGNVTGTPCLAINTWTCVELDYTLGAAAHVQLYVDDVIAIDAVPLDPSPAYDAVYAGVTRADHLGYSVFVDDVVVAQQHIGCR